MMVETLRSLVTDMRSIAPFPHVASTVLSLAAKPGVVPEQLIEVIQTDPGLTGKVLKLCNSAYYGFQREIASLEEAGNMVGVRTLTNLVLTSCSGRYFEEQGAGDSEHAWQSSVATAVAGRMVAQVVGRVDAERAYTSGLLLNVGGLILARLEGDEQARIDAEVAAGRSRVHAERVVLGMSHAEVGARLVTRWMLPEVLIDTLRHHHAPERATLDPTLAATVHLGEALAESLEAEDGDEAEAFGARYGVSDAAWSMTDLLPHVLLELRPRLQAELQDARSALAA